MRHEVLMPRLSEEAEEGVVVTWFVRPGAIVKEGDLLAEVQVEKVSADVCTPAAGRVAELLVAPGGVVAQGAPIAVLEEVGAVAAPAPVASPAAGSVPGRPPAVAAAVEPLTPMRRTIAERLRAGLAEAAQLTLTAEADVTVLAGELARLGEAWGRRVSYTEAAVRAAALALRRHPRLAARWSEAGLVPAERLDVGVAVALEEGLVVPVVRAADEKGLEELSREIADLAERARAGRLEAADTRGGVFSVTNLGGYRVDAFTPLLDPPQTAILGLGRARPRPAVVAGAVVPRTLVVLSLTFDHRVVDGAPAAAFLEEVVDLLEDPARLVI